MKKGAPLDQTIQNICLKIVVQTLVSALCRTFYTLCLLGKLTVLCRVLTTVQIKGFWESVLVPPTWRKYRQELRGCSRNTREGGWNPYFLDILGVNKNPQIEVLGNTVVYQKLDNVMFKVQVANILLRFSMNLRTKVTLPGTTAFYKQTFSIIHLEIIVMYLFLINVMLLFFEGGD